MASLTDKQKATIRKYVEEGLSRKQISNRLGIPEGTISHYQNPHKKQTEKIPQADKVNLFVLTKAELDIHNNRVAESAYRKAAICTIKKLEVFNQEPILKAFKILKRYKEYLIKEYELEEK